MTHLYRTEDQPPWVVQNYLEVDFEGIYLSVTMYIDNCTVGMSKEYKKAVFIFRKDLRLVDNTALIAASAAAEQVIPVFCYDPRQADPEQNPYFAVNAFQFMVESLKELGEEIAATGSTLHLFSGKPEQVLSRILKQVQYQAVFLNQDYTKFSQQRDRKIEQFCEGHRIQFCSYEDSLLVPMGRLPKDFRSYKVFTPFYNRLSQILVVKPNKTAITNFSQQKIDGTVDHPDYKQNKELFLRGGRKAGLKELKSLPQNYQEQHDIFTEKKNTSLLSPYIKFGVLSIREIFYQMHIQVRHHEHLVKQLYARQFYIHVHVANGFEAAQKKYSEVVFPNEVRLFELWKEGKTGFPVIDAAMRMLNRTGFMPRKLRYSVSQFLVKDMLVDWKLGEKYFASRLVDYDPALNNAGWQWAAGLSTDPRPYFMISNPFNQGLKFDKDAIFIKKYVPELESVPAKRIHNWQKESRKEHGTGYPPPCVVHADRKEMFLDLYSAVKGALSVPPEFRKGREEDQQSSGGCSKSRKSRTRR